MPSRKSIIEEWQNPPKYSDDFLRSDQMYEERAVDVVIDNRPSEYRKRQSVPLSTIAIDDVNKNKYDKAIKIQRPQRGETVRSIPIKDYQASIAHNFGTLRRSVAPQLQFESLVSEPEKSVYVSSKKRAPIASSLHQRITSPARTTTQTEITNAQQKSCCHFCSNQHNSHIIRNDKYAKDDQRFDNTDAQKLEDSSDIDEYFHRKFNSNNHQTSVKCTRKFPSNTIATTVTNEDKAKLIRSEQTLQLAEGHVGKKISAYEENERRSLRDFNPKYRSLFEVKGHRTIGVPLVGMHNACGLPVVASWNDHEFLDPLRVSRRIARTVRPIYRSPRTMSNVKRRTQPKRKAPQPGCEMIPAKDVDRSIKRSTIRSARSDAINDSRRSRKKHCRSSLITAKMGSLSSKNSFKKTRYIRHGIKASSLMDTFGRKSLKNASMKRTTLYAKDDGKEPVQVLKNLCLNPLARNNPETDMMW